MLKAPLLSKTRKLPTDRGLQFTNFSELSDEKHSLFKMLNRGSVYSLYL